MSSHGELDAQQGDGEVVPFEVGNRCLFRGLSQRSFRSPSVTEFSTPPGKVQRSSDSPPRRATA